MFRYLHIQCFPKMKDLLRSMVDHGSFTLLPNQDITAEAARFLAQAKTLHEEIAALKLAASNRS